MVGFSPYWCRERSAWLMAVAVFLCAFGFRAIVILHGARFQTVPPTENVRAALSVIRKGELADVFGPGTGLTAHVSPAYPLALSAIFRIFGVGRRGELAVCFFDALLASLAYALYPFVGVRTDISRGAVICAGLLAAFAPLNFWPETGDAHENVALGLVLALLFLCIARIWRSRDFSIRSGAVTGLVVGVGILVSPAIMPFFVGASVATLALFWKERVQYFRSFVASCLLLAVCISPWLLRNWLDFKAPIWSRSNFWMEINVSNNDLAQPLSANNDRAMKRMHPFDSHVQQSRYTDLGEISYQRDEETQAKAWIHNHPRQFLRLTAARIFYFWFPRMASTLATVAMGVLMLAAIAGLIILFSQKNPAAPLFLVLLATFPAVYYLVQALPRYQYPVCWSLKLLAGVTAWSILLKLGRYFRVLPSEL